MKYTIIIEQYKGQPKEYLMTAKGIDEVRKKLISRFIRRDYPPQCTVKADGRTVGTFYIDTKGYPHWRSAISRDWQPLNHDGKIAKPKFWICELGPGSMGFSEKSSDSIIDARRRCFSMSRRTGIRDFSIVRAPFRPAPYVKDPYQSVMGEVSMSDGNGIWYDMATRRKSALNKDGTLGRRL